MTQLTKSRLELGRHPADKVDTPPAWRHLATLAVLLPGMVLAASAASAGDGKYHEAKNRNLSARFQQGDGDRDGKLSRAEFDAMSKSMAADSRAAAQGSRERQPLADTDHMKNDIKNWKVGNEEQWDTHSFFQRADTDNNGQLSRAEFEAASSEQAETIADNARPAVREATTLNDFKDKDEDGDGKLSREEYYGRAALNASNDD